MGGRGVVDRRLTITAPSYDIQLVKKLLVETAVPRDKFFELLDVIDTYIGHIRPYRRDQKALDNALSITKEMRWVASFSFKFRLETYGQLEELFDDLYLEVNG